MSDPAPEPCTRCIAAQRLNNHPGLMAWPTAGSDMLPALARLHCKCGRKIEVDDRALAWYYGLEL